MTDRPVVLFVDPEPNVLDGHRRMMRSLRPNWVPFYAASGVEATVALQRNGIHAVISEIGVKSQDGSELVAYVQKHWPQIIRIVLSSETDGESQGILRSTQAAHQFLVKPCKGDALLTRIEQAIELRTLLKNPELQKIVTGLPYLPSLPPLYHELIAAIEDPDTSLEAIGDIVAKDVSMTTRVLHLVNSAFFGLPRKITRPQEAAVLLGLNTIKSLVLYVKLFFAAPDSPIPGLSLDDLWAHSSLCATVARDLVKHEGGDRRMQEDAMLAGMLHDLGKLLILDERRYVNAVIQRMSDGTTFADAEYAEFNTSHAEIGAYLLGLWGLPDVIVQAVACHQRPQLLTQTEFSPVTAVHVANAVLNAKGNEAPAVDAEYLSRIGAGRKLAQWQQVAKTTIERVKR